MAAEPEYVPHSTETVYDIARDVVQLLKQLSETLAISESLTGSGVMAAVTSVKDCSAVFRDSIVSYATPLKQHLLNVNGDLISESGIIHSDIATQMASGARTLTAQQDMTPTSWGIGTTGVAGPDSQDGKPAGMVFIGVASASGSKGFGPFISLAHASEFEKRQSSKHFLSYGTNSRRGEIEALERRSTYLENAGWWWRNCRE